MRTDKTAYTQPSSAPDLFLRLRKQVPYEFRPDAADSTYQVIMFRRLQTTHQPMLHVRKLFGDNHHLPLRHRAKLAWAALPVATNRKLQGGVREPNDFMVTCESAVTALLGAR